MVQARNGQLSTIFTLLEFESVFDVFKNRISDSNNPSLSLLVCELYSVSAEFWSPESGPEPLVSNFRKFSPGPVGPKSHYFIRLVVEVLP